MNVKLKGGQSEEKETVGTTADNSSSYRQSEPSNKTVEEEALSNGVCSRYSRVQLFISLVFVLYRTRTDNCK